jgi:hypothetical protein
MRCKHVYKKNKKYFIKDFNLINIFGNQFDNSLNNIGIIFYQCRLCGKVKNIKINIRNKDIDKIYELMTFRLFFRRIFFNDDIKKITKTKDYINTILKKVGDNYGWT